ncbi:glycosyltransferase family 2 protein [Anaerocolumna aminovalerica]|uniref:tetratricopeptide repeat-containing glycosyltransferase family 2 protein n=1 Tax=Anaerocolumna aminovalerica TaxID=1527 RepID=UPI000BE3E555|nr:glycosyltransferase family 2 protein [Anaerocolumna aminovalerica]
MSLSVCILAKNEEERIQRCIRSVISYVDEVIVVDNGSIDHTADIAIQEGAKVLFSSAKLDLARNRYLEEAKSDWIFVLDADELIMEKDIIRMKEVTDQDTESNGFFIPSYQYFGEGRYALFFMSRLYRRQEGLRYDRPIHSRIRSSLQSKNKTFKLLYAPIHHLDGIISQDRNIGKRERNISRLIEYLEKNQSKIEQTQVGMLYCHLGREYCALNDFKKGKELFMKAVKLDNKGVAIISLAQMYSITKEWDDALYWGKKHLEFIGQCNNYEEVIWRREGTIAALVRSYNGLGDFEKALEYINLGLSEIPILLHHHINKYFILKSMNQMYEFDSQYVNEFYLHNLKCKLAYNTIYKLQDNFIDTIGVDDINAVMQEQIKKGQR